MLERDQTRSATTAARSQTAFDEEETEAGDQVVVIHNLGWKQFYAISTAIGEEHPSVRMSYLDGRLEIMVTGWRHDYLKGLIARLLEHYAFEKNIAITGFGQMTFLKKGKASFEADDCYVVGEWPKREPERPDFAIEVVMRGPGVGKLSVYREKRVPEVWFWLAKENRFSLHRLHGRKYRAARKSRFFPELDFSWFASFVASDKPQWQVVREFHDRIRKS